MNLKRAFKSKAAIPAYLLVAALVGYVVVDLVQTTRQTGIYRPVYAGTVLKTRRTFLGYLSIAEGCASFCSDASRGRTRHRHSSRDRGYRSSGHWVAKIHTEDGRIMDVAISERYYRSVKPGHYVISRAGDPVYYISRAVAFKRVGAKE
jgi:hypothetical protein